MKIEIIAGADTNPVAEFFSSSNTPETDAFAVKFKSVCGSKAWVPKDICRRFELERDEARSECKALWVMVDTEKKKTYTALRERDEAREERDIARLSALDSDKAHDRMVGELEKVYAARDEARKEAEYYRERYEQLKGDREPGVNATRPAGNRL